MHPELFRIGDFPINTYGLLLALALLTGISVAARLAARDGLPSSRIYDLSFWMILGVLFGSKLLMVLTEPEYRENLRHLLSLDFLRSAGVFYGGFIGGFVAVTLGVYRWRLPWAKTGDAAMCGVALGQGIGRLACFSAGCCWGKPTTLPWGVEFTELAHENTGVPLGVHLHPTQLYESFAMLLVFGLLVWLHRRRRFDGQVMFCYFILYAIVRFTVEFVRADPRGDIMGLTTLTGLSTSQLISLVFAALGLVALIVRWRRVAAATNRAAFTAPPTPVRS